MRLAYLGPEGTFTHEALLAATRGDQPELIPCRTVYDTVRAVHDRQVERALVPIENSLEGGVNATLDAVATTTDSVTIVGEVVYPISHCLIARAPLALADIETVVSHPQANAQCARFIRTRLPAANVLAASSTADAVRMVAEHEGPWGALGNRLAAELYGCELLLQGVEDVAGNETRFVWLGQAGVSDPGGACTGPWKTAVVFWGGGSDTQPGWLMRCLAEFASREVNLTRIESRPRKLTLGRYMFFVDLEGRDTDGPVADALAALRAHVRELRVLGSFPAAPSGPSTRG